MRIVRVRETVQQEGWINLHHLTDMHAGAPDFAEEEFRARVKLIEDDPWARWTMGGDAGDLIRHNDRRYQPTELHPRYRQATDIVLATQHHVQEMLGPIADKCWGWADGNHEGKVDEVYGGHFSAEICTRMGIERRYVDRRGFIHVAFQIEPRKAGAGVLIDLQHGWQAGRGAGAFQNQSEKDLSMTEADIVLRGHSHRPNVYTCVTLDLDNKRTRVVQRQRTVINGGCWRLGYRNNVAPVTAETLHETERSMWQEKKGFRIEPLGGPVLQLGFDQGRSNADGAGRPTSITHTVFDGPLSPRLLGMAA